MIEQEKVEDQKQNLTIKEEIVQQRAQGNRQGEAAPSPILKQLVHSPQQKRKEHNDFMKMIVHQINVRKAGKGIKQRAQNRVIQVSDMTLQPEKADQSGSNILQNEQPADQIGKGRFRKQSAHPEEGTAQSIKAEGTNEIDTQIGIPVPGGSSVPNGPG
ncbi:hypothetical protein SDC9_142808 [bioreactor metagenome]|uniref:Uncharacterized protein n=1 Tax=bioreactor metagenome TaxID=1076179 RepID=A0A645E4C8_9ZZZZ